MKKLQKFVLLALVGVFLVGCAEKPIAIQEGENKGKGGGAESTKGLKE